MNQSTNQLTSQLHLKLIDRICELLDPDIAFLVQLLMKSIYKYTTRLNKVQYTYIMVRMIILARMIITGNVNIPKWEMPDIEKLLETIGEDDGPNSPTETTH